MLLLRGSKLADFLTSAEFQWSEVIPSNFSIHYFNPCYITVENLKTSNSIFLKIRHCKVGSFFLGHPVYAFLCLFFRKSESQYAYKWYAYRKNMCVKCYQNKKHYNWPVKSKMLGWMTYGTILETRRVGQQHIVTLAKIKIWPWTPLTP